MLSYRHSFHAGNFADVLKHLCLCHILEYMTQKDKPLCYIDTHAGAGGYSLSSVQAEKNREYLGGISKLWSRQQADQALQGYLDLVKQFNKTSRLQSYPGSPWLARQLLRDNDRLFLCELHNQDVQQLKNHCQNDPRVQVLHDDGLQQCLRLLPPKERRALVLIDPSYEIKTDYKSVSDTLIKAHRRFATGCYALWYPVVERPRIKRLEKNLQQSGIRNILLLELCVDADSQPGMSGSGMIIINPPWQLAEDMKNLLPGLCQRLAGDNKGSWRVQWLAAE